MKKTNSLIYFFFCFLSLKLVFGVQILSKSKLETCEKTSDSDNLNCSMKIVVNMAVPTESSGREASIIAEIVEVEDNSSNKMQTVRIPPTITVNKSAAYAIYELTYIRDVPYKPEEFYVKTRKCEPDADAKVVAVCERLRDEQGHVMEYTQPICCPCGTWPRVPSSCGNFFDKMLKGKPNTAHCLRFPGDWFHVFGIGRRSIGFSVRIEVKKGTQVSEVFVGPENRTVSSTDNFLRVNLIGDFAGYTSIPSFEDFYLVIPRQGGPGQPENLGGNFSMWMLLERVRFTLDGLECNKIGVSYEAYNGQPNFCASPFWSCLHNQLWNFWDADRNRISRSQLPLYGVEGRFERINQHPNAGSHSFSIGITEVLNSNLLIELNADDIEYVFQRSPGKIISVTIPTFEALTQFGVATVTTKNIGKLEASYSLTFDCSKGITLMEEQFFIMKAEEIAVRSFKLYPTIDQAAKYVCSAILKDSDFNEVDRAECQFTTTATILDNGSQTPFEPPKNGANGIFSSIGSIWKNMGDGFIDFITGKSCRSKCSGFFDFSCHIQYICMSWVVLFGLLLAIFPTVMVLLWLLHQKGFFDPLYDWWDDIIEPGNQGSVIESQHVRDLGHHHHEHLHKYHKHEGKHYKHHTQSRRRSTRHSHRHVDPESESDYHNPKQGNHLYHAHQYRFKHEGRKSSSAIHHGYSQRREKLYRKGHRENLTDERFEQHGHGKKWEGL